MSYSTTIVAPIIIEFCGEPVAKGRPRFSTRGKFPVAFTPAKTRTYEDALRYAAQKAMEGRSPIAGPVDVTIMAFLPTPRSMSKAKRKDALAGTFFPIKRPDVDNFAKIAADSLNSIVFADDSQIVDLTVSKRYSDRPRLRIEVRAA